MPRFNENELILIHKRVNVLNPSSVFSLRAPYGFINLAEAIDPKKFTVKKALAFIDECLDLIIKQLGILEHQRHVALCGYRGTINSPFAVGITVTLGLIALNVWLYTVINRIPAVTRPAWRDPRYSHGGGMADQVGIMPASPSSSGIANSTHTYVDTSARDGATAGNIIFSVFVGLALIGLIIGVVACNVGCKPDGVGQKDKDVNQLVDLINHLILNEQSKIAKQDTYSTEEYVAKLKEMKFKAQHLKGLYGEYLNSDDSVETTGMVQYVEMVRLDDAVVRSVVANLLGIKLDDGEKYTSTLTV